MLVDEEQLKSKMGDERFKTLHDFIKLSIKESMKEAFLETFKLVDNYNVNITKEDIAEAFAEKACKCGDDISLMIDTYIKTQMVTIPTGTVIPVGTGLISPAGPVTGAILVAGSSTPMVGAIN